MTVREWLKEFQRRWPYIVSILRGHVVLFGGHIDATIEIGYRTKPVFVRGGHDITLRNGVIDLQED
jgi:hypothetical protein